MSLPVIPTNHNGTTYIAVIFVFLAYGLHPTIEKALERLRAYRAWVNIEKGESIEVTNVSAIADTMRGRGRWDAARVTAILLIVFSVASWGLELALDLENVTDGPVDMMDRPPPIVLRSGTSDAREVRDDLDIPGSDGGFLGNFRGTLEEGSATTRYRVGSVEYKGSTLAARWSNDYSAKHSALSYDVYGNGTAVLSSLDCTSQESGDIYIGAETEEKWGTIEECGTGPATVASTDCLSAPTIVLKNDATEEFHLVVEEESNYPGFMYSVWIPEDDIAPAVSSDGTTKHIKHAFHVASKSRMVEAIVTGILNGVETGGGCVDLLFQHSQLYTKYDLPDGTARASPFGERPGRTSSVDDLSVTEPIELGVRANNFASACLIIVLIVSVVGVGCSACVNSRIGLDVYDRDELFKVASLLRRGQGQSATKGGHISPPLPAMRIFVRKDAYGELEITVSHAVERSSGYCRGSPSAVVDERGQSNTVRHTGGETRIRLQGILVDTTPTNDFPKCSPLSSSQGSVTSKVALTVAPRPRPRHVHAPSSEIATSVQSQMPRAPKPVSRIAHVQALKQYTRGRSHARKKSRAQQASKRQPFQGLAEVWHAAHYTGDTTPRPVSPMTSSRTRASKSKNKEKPRLSAPEELLLQRHNVVLSDAQRPARQGAARARAARDKAAARATFRTPMKKGRGKKSTNRNRAAATLDGEAALGATFGRPPTVTE